MVFISARYPIVGLSPGISICPQWLGDGSQPPEGQSCWDQVSLGCVPTRMAGSREECVELASSRGSLQLTLPPSPPTPACTGIAPCFFQARLCSQKGQATHPCLTASRDVPQPAAADSWIVQTPRPSRREAAEVSLGCSPRRPTHNGWLQVVPQGQRAALPS